MKVHEVEDNTMREVAEADVVVLDALASIDHLHIVEVRLVHGFEQRNLNINSPEIKFGSLIWIHTNKLIALVASTKQRKGYSYIRGGDLNIAGVLSQNIFIGDIRLEKQGL